MWQRTLVAILVVLFVCGTARPAQADMMAIWRWWDSLSGPGPCTGVVFDQRLFSRGQKTGTAETATFFDPGLRVDENSRRPVKFGVQVGALKCRNELPYADGSAPDVWAFPLAGTVDVRTIPAVDVGLTVGTTAFRGDGFSTWKLTLGPRVTLSPGVLFTQTPTRRHRALQITLTASTIVGDLTAADFGAIGDFKGGNEVLWSTSVSLNLLNLKK